MLKRSIKIYLASSFAYNDKQLTEQRKATMQLASDYLKLNKGITVYNPATMKIKNAWDYSMWDWGNLVFKKDKQHLDESDIVVFLSYGKENNAGSVWEVGYAYAKDKPIILVSMDPTQPESLMVVHSAYTCLKGLDSLLKYDFQHMPIHTIDVVES